MPSEPLTPPGDRCDDGEDAFAGVMFSSAVVDRVRRQGGVWAVPRGELLLPRVFGFCRGVQRALAVLEQAVDICHSSGKRVVLLGQIIHNPWVNAEFERRGVHILSPAEREALGKHVSASDCAVIPAFGVPLPVERRLQAIGCEVVDTSCGNVRRLWAWAERAVGDGRAVLIFGRARHDETVVTKSRLAAAGGRYVVAGDTDEVRAFCGMISGARNAQPFGRVFGRDATNAESVAPFLRLAQVSQTTMLYEETMRIRELVRSAFEQRFGRQQAERRVLFEPTVCRATQDRQAAAVELCRCGLDLAVVVGGFGSSNTRHLHELACQYVPAFLIEDAGAIRSGEELRGCQLPAGEASAVRGWLPDRRPLRIGVLSGASTPEVVVGQVLQRLADLL